MLGIDELKAKLAIDKLSLDEEVIRQPVLFYEVSELLTEALAERDGAKEELNNVDAQLSKHWRQKLSTGSKNRITDAQVLTCVQTDKDHKEAFDVWLDAKTKADKLQVLKEAFQQRSYMLRDMVTLYSSNYYESSAVKPTKAVDDFKYNANRARLAAARTK